MSSLFHSILNLQVYKEQINCFLHMKAFGVFKRSPRIPLQYSLPWIQYHKSFEESSPFILQFPLQFSALNIFYFLSISLKVRSSKLNKMSSWKATKWEENRTITSLILYIDQYSQGQMNFPWRCELLWLLSMTWFTMYTSIIPQYSFKKEKKGHILLFK